MFEGFRETRIRTAGAEIHMRVGGSGPPLLLLHGFPQTHVMWHRLAPVLAERFTVVCPDLRGYGASSKPEGGPDHAGYAKRAMAQDMAEVMDRLGHARFHVVGHDRGGRVGHRLARDHAARVATLSVLDICPTLAMYERTDRAFATAYYHWFMLIQPAPLPERMLAAVGPTYILGRVGGASGQGAFTKAALAEYERAFADPRTIHATCEDYRASATIDLEHDRTDRARKLAMPVLALWGARGVVGRMFDCLSEWRAVARNVTGQALDCSHFLPEEAPEATLAAVQGFLDARPMGKGRK